MQLKTSWDLDSLFDRVSRELAIEEGATAVPSLPLDEELEQRVWAASHAHTLRGRDEDAARFQTPIAEEGEADHGEGDEDDEVGEGDAAPHASTAIEHARAELEAWKSEGLNLNAAISSGQSHLQEKAYSAQLHVARHHVEGLMEHACSLAREDRHGARANPLPPMALLQPLLATNKTFLERVVSSVGRRLHPYELIAPGPTLMASASTAPGTVDPRVSKEASGAFLEGVIGFFDSLLPSWGNRIRTAFERGLVDIAPAPGKRGGAMTFPWHPGEGPLVYVQDALSAKVGSSDLSLVHELAHAVHFAAYADSPRWHELPPDDVLEVLPHYLEDLYLASNGREMERALRRAAYLNLSWCWLAFRDRKAASSEARDFPLRDPSRAWAELWRGVIEEAFGECLEERFLEEPLWLVHRMATRPWTDAVPYLSGPAIAYAWADAGVHREGGLRHVETLLREGPGTSLGGWWSVVRRPRTEGRDAERNETRKERKEISP